MREPLCAPGIECNHAWCRAERRYRAVDAEVKALDGTEKWNNYLMVKALLEKREDLRTMLRDYEGTQDD